MLHGEQQRDWIALNPVMESSAMAPRTIGQVADHGLRANPDHDVIRLVAPQERDTEELRADLEAELDAIMAELESEIAHLTVTQHEFENEDAIDALSRQTSYLQGVRAHAGSVDAAGLLSLARSMPQIQSASATVLRTAATDGSFQTAAHMTEVTLEKLQKLEIGTIAETLTADRFARMSTAELDAVGRRVDQHVAESFAAERDAHSRIEDAATASGADLSIYREQRAKLQAEEEQARRNGDRVALARAAWLQSTNSLHGAETAGLSPAEIDERRQQTKADEDAFRLAVRERAAREARAQGKTGKEAAEHIADAEAREVSAAQARVEEINAAHGVTTEAEKAEQVEKHTLLDKGFKSDRSRAFAGIDMPADERAGSPEAGFANAGETPPGAPKSAGLSLAMAPPPEAAQEAPSAESTAAPKQAKLALNLEEADEAELGGLPKPATVAAQEDAEKEGPQIG